MTRIIFSSRDGCCDSLRLFDSIASRKLSDGECNCCCGVSCRRKILFQVHAFMILMFVNMPVGSLRKQPPVLIGGTTKKTTMTEKITVNNISNLCVISVYRNFYNVQFVFGVVIHILFTNCCESILAYTIFKPRIPNRDRSSLLA